MKTDESGRHDEQGRDRFARPVAVASLSFEEGNQHGKIKSTRRGRTRGEGQERGEFNRRRHE